MVKSNRGCSVFNPSKKGPILFETSSSLVLFLYTTKIPMIAPMIEKQMKKILVNTSHSYPSSFYKINLIRLTYCSVRIDTKTITKNES